MEAAHDNRRQLGQLMVDEGILTSDQLTHALAEQDRTGQPLGEILVELGFASPGAVANSLAEQHGGLLKTEYGVSAGLRTVTDAGMANAPVRPVLPASGEETEGQDKPVGLRVIPMYPPPVDGPPLVPTPVVEMPDPPAQIPNAEEARIADLSSRLDDTAGKLRVSQQARDAFSKRVAELEAQLESGAPGDAAPQADPAQAARIEQLETHIQQLDEHIKAAAADREKIVQHYTELQAQLAAAQAATPEADPAQAARIQELEAQLQAAAVDREALAESLTELQARLSETSQARDAERTETSAGTEARVSVLEGQLKDAAQERGILEKRTSELQGALLASEQARAGEIQSAVAEALERVAELEAHLKQAEVSAAEPGAGMAELEAQLQAISAERDAMLAGLAEHEATVATLREHLADRNRLLEEQAEAAKSEGESDSGRVAELEAQLASQQTRALEIESATAAAVARVAELEAQLQQAELAATAVASETSEASDGRAAELEAQLNSLREELADRDRQLAERPSEHEPATVGLRALVEHVEHEAMAGLREDIADRDRRLAENVNEIARVNRELAESAEREAAMTSLRSELADRDRQLTDRAMLVENVEHQAMAGLREDLAERDRQLAETAGLREELVDRDRRLAEIAEEIAQMNRAHDATVASLRDDLADRELKLAESVDQLGQLKQHAAAPAFGDSDLADDEKAHVLFIPTSSGYSLLERSGPAPAIGETVEVDGESENAGHFVVRKHGRPVPGGPRCAYVERV